MILGNPVFYKNLCVLMPSGPHYCVPQEPLKRNSLLSIRLWPQLYAKRTHLSDALGYMIAQEFGMHGRYGEMPGSPW